MADEDGQFILSGLSGFTRGIAEAMKFKAQMALKERELDLKSQEISATLGLKDSELGRKAYQDLVRSNEHTDTLNAYKDRTTAISTNKDKSNQAEMDKADLKSIDVSLRNIRQEKRRLAEKIADKKDSLARFDKGTPEYTTALENITTHQGLLEDAQNDEVRLENEREGLKRPKGTKGLKGARDGAREVGPDTAVSFDDGIQMISRAQTEAELLQLLKKFKAMPAFKGKEGAVREMIGRKILEIYAPKKEKRPSYNPVGDLELMQDKGGA